MKRIISKFFKKKTEVKQQELPRVIKSRETLTGLEFDNLVLDLTDRVLLSEDLAYVQQECLWRMTDKKSFILKYKMASSGLTDRYLKAWSNRNGFTLEKVSD